ncbi:MAG: Pycsar system effector family protein [Psychroserpens sp.]|uniref:Pycsar system effector family protein n=1 Tax=Psychroserpens sp. TaxID=2020870 RepID=UPI003C74F216
MSDLLDNIENLVYDLFQENSKHLPYHNYDNTIRVVNYVKLLAQEENINQIDTEALIIAAYFHNVAYQADAEHHEDLAADKCSFYLQEQGKNAEFIDKVKAIILSADPKKVFTTNLDRLLNDAINGHLSHKNFVNYSDLLRREKEILENDKIEVDTWNDKNIKYLEKHRFFTDYAKEHWQPLKEKLIFSLYKERDKSAVKKVKKEVPEKGIETAFRVALKNHMKLSDIADAKANILLSVNAIIISVALSTLIPKLDNPSNAHLIWPAISLIGFSVVAIIFSIFSTRPKVTKGTFTREDIKNRKVNLLFFGNFHSVSLDDFKHGMHAMMEDKEYLYDSLISDLYFLGKVLHKKYNLLRITYNIFLVGLIISITVFAVMLNQAV